MNTKLLKSKLLEAAFNGSLTHADTSTWEDFALGEIFLMKAGKNVTAADISEEQNEKCPYPCYGGNGLRGYVKDYNTEGIFPIIGRQGALCGNVKYVEGKFFATEHAVVVRNKKEVDSRWAFHALTFLNLNQYATATAQPGLAVSKIEQVRLSLPPLAEQQRIVAALEEGFAYIDAVASAKQNLSDTAELLRSKILQVAMQGKLVPQDKNEEAASVLIAKIKGEIQSISEEEVPFEIPSNWVWVRHNELFDISGGTQPPKSEFIDEPRAGYIQLYQIRDYGPKPQPVYVPYKKTLKISKKGDILLARYGASLGKVFIAKEGAYNVAIARVVPLFKEDYIDKKFLYLYYKSSIYQTHITKHSRSAQAGFNKEDLKEMLFPLPPLAEQQRIVAKIEELFAEIDKLK